MKSAPRRTWLKKAGAIALAPYVITARSQETLIVNTQGGEYQELVEKVVIRPFEIANERWCRDRLHRALEVLPELHREVIELRFGLTRGRPHTLDELALVLGVSREHIRQIERQALEKLETLPQAQPLRDAS